MQLFLKLVDENQILKPSEPIRVPEISLPLRVIHFVTFQYETPCTTLHTYTYVVLSTHTHCMYTVLQISEAKKCMHTCRWGSVLYVAWLCI